MTGARMGREGIWPNLRYLGASRSLSAQLLTG